MYEDLKIVIVEDDRALNELICRRLRRKNHHPVGFHNAAEAVEYLKGNDANLLITDMNLPDYSGERLISLLAENNIKIPFIVATGQGSEAIAFKMLKKGARDYLVKSSGFLDVLPSTVEMVWHEVQLESLLDKARRQIHVQNATLSAISEFSPDGIIAVDDDDQILSFNKTLCNICGVDYNHKFQSGKDFFEFINNSVVDCDEFAGTVASIGHGFSGNLFKELSINGLFFDLFSTPMTKDGDATPSGRIWYFTDVTEHKSATETMIAAQKESEATAKMRSQFFAVVSHDVKTPLNSIIGFLGLLEESELTDIQTNYIKSIQSSGEHLMHLINDILDFTRIEHGAIELNIQPLPLHGILNECIYNFMPNAEGSDFELKIEIDDSVPEVVNSDMLRIKQIIMNLLANAVKFTRKGSVSLSATMDGDDTVIKVIDTGIGISDEVQKYLFSPFTQADASITETYGGSGLGLAISKQLAERLGGSLTLESKLEAGSTFTLTLPLNSN